MSLKKVCTIDHGFVNLLPAHPPNPLGAAYLDYADGGHRFVKLLPAHLPTNGSAQK
jgi:hypothetical protein